MKNIVVLMAFSVAILSGCGQEVRGKVTLTGTQAIPLVDEDGKTVEIGAGDASLRFKKSLFGAKLAVKSGGTEVEMKLPRKILKSGTREFYFKAEKIDQLVDLQGSTTTQIIATRQVDGVDNCYGYGFCAGPCYSASCHPYYGPNLPGHYPPGYHPPGFPGGYFTYRPDCPGVVDVRRTYQTMHEVLLVNFLDSRTKGKPILGSFEGDRGTYEELTAVHLMGSCRIF